MTSEASSELLDALRAETSAAGLHLSEEQLALAERHARLLLQANQRTNLTRITEPRELARRHFAESFLATELWGPAPDDRPLRVLDVGSGGGFPGLAGRILRPDVELTCLEPRAAKAAFLSRVAAGFPEPRPRVRNLRLEQFHVEHLADVVTFRALALPANAIAACCATGGRVVAFPGGEETWSAELEASGWCRADARSLPGGSREAVCWVRND